ncbi:MULTISPECIES: alpha/beta hydrolase [Olivibacter]|uniref:AB hydrolase-1 domain-containing protein n=2 Tax=Sphingobacteriaceae TaxID=84566 RepID=F4C7R9_SPHS2|nr:alpha/beta hydrolase [Olivibacter sp. LS-1]MDX3914785.1 alpha/beta hydrolase [Pseudosphingobacterium sp.]QEL03405.1 alpha/beta hydrolase [Olivibacter sp. LS-1]
MKTVNYSKGKVALIVAVVLANLAVVAPQALAQKKKVKNVVIVHGAFADGSGWKSIYDILSAKGYEVSIVQNPLTSLKDDVEATNRIIDRQDGPVVLVGHSWGGTVITEAGNHSKVAALVYVAAHQPDEGENTIQWVKTAPVLPENGILPPDDKGYVYYDRAKFHAGFAADVPAEEAAFMFASQQPINGAGFVETITKAAWRTKPSYGIVATEDKSINPDIERNLYKRSGTKTVEVKGSHVIFMTHPEEVADVIIAASENQ